MSPNELITWIFRLLGIRQTEKRVNKKSENRKNGARLLLMHKYTLIFSEKIQTTLLFATHITILHIHNNQNFTYCFVQYRQFDS